MEAVMFYLINQMGIFGLLLTILFLTNIFLTVKYTVILFRENDNKYVDINKLIFVGVFSLALGFFSHFLGLYEASKFITQFNDAQIANGYGQSLLPLLFGFIIFFISAISWFVLRIKIWKL